LEENILVEDLDDSQSIVVLQTTVGLLEERTVSSLLIILFAEDQLEIQEGIVTLLMLMQDT
jgi:hypothetical protein